MTGLRVHQFQSNQVRLWLTVIVSKPGGNLWRRLVLPQRVRDWSLTSLQAGRVVSVRYRWLLRVEGNLTL
jgi:hypothetical protein